jgi:hypothetical protein
MKESNQLSRVVAALIATALFSLLAICPREVWANSDTGLVVTQYRELELGNEVLTPKAHRIRLTEVLRGWFMLDCEWPSRLPDRRGPTILIDDGRSYAWTS